MIGLRVKSIIKTQNMSENNALIKINYEMIHKTSLKGDSDIHGASFEESSVSLTFFCELEGTYAVKDDHRDQYFKMDLYVYTYFNTEASLGNDERKTEINILYNVTPNISANAH